LPIKLTYYDLRVFQRFVDNLPETNYSGDLKGDLLAEKAEFQPKAELRIRTMFQLTHHTIY